MASMRFLNFGSILDLHSGDTRRRAKAWADALKPALTDSTTAEVRMATAWLGKRLRDSQTLCRRRAAPTWSFLLMSCFTRR